MKYDSHKFLLQPDSQLMINHCCYCSDAFFVSVAAQKMKRAQVMSETTSRQNGQIQNSRFY